MFLQVKQAAHCQQHCSASQSRAGKGNLEIPREKCKNQEVSNQRDFSEAFPEQKPPEANKESCLSKVLKPNLG